MFDEEPRGGEGDYGDEEAQLGSPRVKLVEQHLDVAGLSGPTAVAYDPPQ